MNSGVIHVMVVGLRGFPRVQGGVETHAEKLFPLIAEKGVRITVILRTTYVGKDHPSEWKGIKFKKIGAPKIKSLEAIVHTFFGVLYAAVVRPDILHIHAIGPSLLTPLARLLGLKVVVTHHGPDYDRQKWGVVARFFLRLGEKAGCLFANKVIAVSNTIRRSIHKQYGTKACLIRNGVDLCPIPESMEELKARGLVPQKYVLTVGRFVPEKRQTDLIRAFSQAVPDGWKLVLVGEADYASSFSQELKELAARTPDVILTGFLKGRPLEEIYAHAGLFVLPSSHEGLPIALLEALSYGLPVIASDIPPHMEIELPNESYFRLGNCDDLASKIAAIAAKKENDEERRETLRQWLKDKYSWPTAAERTVSVYRTLMGQSLKSL